MQEIENRVKNAAGWDGLARVAVLLYLLLKSDMYFNFLHKFAIFASNRCEKHYQMIERFFSATVQVV